MACGGREQAQVTGAGDGLGPAVGVDYNIFLSARIREESRRLGLRDVTLHALGVTGGVITAAGQPAGPP